MQRELHPTLLSSLEGIVDQMVWFRENWHEEVSGFVLKRVFLYSKGEWLPLKAHQPQAQVKHDMNAFSVRFAYVV